MQKWECVKIIYTYVAHLPQSIAIWPSGVIDLEWLSQRFGVRIQERNGTDIIDKLFQNAPHVSIALTQHLGLNGWEAVTHSPYIKDSEECIFFKRPVQDDSGNSN